MRGVLCRADLYRRGRRDRNRARAGVYTFCTNNICLCSCIANVSCAVAASFRGLHIGEKLVPDCLTQAKAHGFCVMQLNAAVASSTYARHLYERLGFVPPGVSPAGSA